MRPDRGQILPVTTLYGKTRNSAVEGVIEEHFADLENEHKFFRLRMILFFVSFLLFVLGIILILYGTASTVIFQNFNKNTPCTISGYILLGELL